MKKTNRRILSLIFALLLCVPTAMPARYLDGAEMLRLTAQ